MTRQGIRDSTLNKSAAPHSQPGEQVLRSLGSAVHGLSLTEVTLRQHRYGLNRLPQAKQTTLLTIFFRQFLNPLIYILLLAATIAFAVGKVSDTVFILIVLLLNAVIGTFQEYSAQKSAAALSRLVTHVARVIRDGAAYELTAEELVPGDIVLVESGDKLPADMRLLSEHDLSVDESLLTGESTTVQKQSEAILPEDTVLADRHNMLHAGTLVTRGRGTGVITSTGLQTRIGQIAEGVLSAETVKPPLIIRMEQFTNRIGILMGVVITFIAVISLSRGMAVTEVMMVSIALAVAAIPEGLPVAMTVALSISMRRMAKRHVIVRRLVTVEALGSCTYIATDKTGTLTANELTIQQVCLPDGTLFSISGVGMDPVGEIVSNQHLQPEQAKTPQIAALAKAGVYTNEAFLGQRDGHWAHHGDAVDIAFLVLGHKLAIDRPILLESAPELDTIPYESSTRYSAALHKLNGENIVYVKGAVEEIINMCRFSQTDTGKAALDITVTEKQAHQLAERGYRVLAVARGLVTGNTLHETKLIELEFLGLVGIIDPLREHTREAIQSCRSAGIDVAMITGDHPITALAISKHLQLADTIDEVATGKELALYQDQELDQLVREKHVFARIEPQQKTDIVQSLQRNGHFVAVTGDGANDAPAMRAAHVGVSMGKTGTDVARETADMIITDDNFASIVAGIEEGRIAYANIRKVIFLLISTGAAEIVLFIFSILSGLPMPLTAVQLLWLNLVTNGIQDIALAFEPAEGDELKRPARSPNEPIFNRIMIQRVAISALVMGSVAYVTFYYLLGLGMDIEASRNIVLLLMVLFENVHVLNSRSETRSIFHMRLFSNPLLIFGTIAAQLIHIGSMYTPGLKEILQTSPVSLEQWFVMLLLATSLLVSSEIYKAIVNKKTT